MSSDCHVRPPASTAVRAAILAVVLVTAIAPLSSARPDPDWSTIDATALAREKDEAAALLTRITEKDTTGAASALGLTALADKDAEAWAQAVGERVEALRALLAVLEEADRFRVSAEVLMQLRTAKAELGQEERRPEPAVRGKVSEEDLARLRAGVATAKEESIAAEMAWESLRTHLDSVPSDLEAIEKLGKELRGRREAATGTDALSVYRRGTLKIGLRRVSEESSYLEIARQRGPAALELRDVNRRIAVLRLRHAENLLAASETSFGEQLSAQLEHARNELRPLEADPATDPELLRKARQKVELLSVQVATERSEAHRKSVAEWRDREAAANEQLADRLARLRERLTDTAGVSSSTPELLTTNLKFVRENRDYIGDRLLPDLKDRLREQIQARADVLDRFLGSSPPDGVEAAVDTGAEVVRAARRAHYDRLNGTVQLLLEIDGLYAARKGTLAEMHAFLLGNMYWVRSDNALGSETGTGVVDELRRIADAWLGDRNQEKLRAAANREPWRFILLALGFLALTVGGIWLHRRLSAYHTRWKYRGGAFAVIVQRLVANMLISSLAPLVLFLSTFLLGLLSLPPTVTLPVRTLLVGAAIVLFFRRFFGAIFRENGLVVTNMGAPPAVAAQLRRASRIATNGMLLVALPWQILRTFPVEPALAHIPRILFMVLQAWAAFVLLGLLRRRGALIEATTGGRVFWARIAAILGPLVFLATVFVLAMDGLGYRFGAHELGLSILQTLLAGLVLAGAYNLLTNLLNQASRRYRQKMRPEVGDAEADELAEKLSGQVSRFIGVAAIVLTVPLLAGFWDLGGSIRGVFESLRITSVNQETGVWLTGWDILKSIAWICGGHFVVANLAGLLQVVLFARLPGVQTGTRFAVAAIAKYVILLIAYAAAILSLHMSFSSLGWALAAVSLGVGFGMQEIVSNFVSGLILFFERPVRVGDVVTVGTTLGTVEKINIRATQILNWDRQVIILPNRKFISEEVVNWTHNDPVIRATTEVGVAYGTDMVRVREVLFEIVSAEPNARQDPPPRVWFWAFGDSTLNVRVHVFTEFEYRVQIVNDLNIEISRRFAEEGIEIAFPQRDLHLRSVQDPAVLRALPPDVAHPLTPAPEELAPEELAPEELAPEELAPENPGDESGEPDR